MKVIRISKEMADLLEIVAARAQQEKVTPEQYLRHLFLSQGIDLDASLSREGGGSRAAQGRAALPSEPASLVCAIESMRERSDPPAESLRERDANILEPLGEWLNGRPFEPGEVIH